MPIYEYEPDGTTCEACDGGFESIQSFHDEPLTKCPECGNPCHRIFSTFAMNTRLGGDMLSNKNLESKGFTQYKKSSDGKYEKTFGSGPDMIKRD